MSGKHVAPKMRRTPGKKAGSLAAAVVIGPVLMLSLGAGAQASEMTAMEMPPNTVSVGAFGDTDAAASQQGEEIPAVDEDKTLNPASLFDDIVNPIEPELIDPVDPVEPGPVDPVDPVEPVEPVPVDPVDPGPPTPEPPVVLPPVVDPPVVDPPVVNQPVAYVPGVEQPVSQVPVGNAVGTYVPVVAGTGVVRVAAQEPAASGQQLAYTGAGDQSPVLAIGAGLMVAGAGAMLVTRAGKGRRRAV